MLIIRVCTISKVRSALINILQIIVFSYKLFFDNAKKFQIFWLWNLNIFPYLNFLEVFFLRRLICSRNVHDHIALLIIRSVNEYRHRRTNVISICQQVHGIRQKMILVYNPHLFNFFMLKNLTFFQTISSLLSCQNKSPFWLSMFPFAPHLYTFRETSWSESLSFSLFWMRIFFYFWIRSSSVKTYACIRRLIRLDGG